MIKKISLVLLIVAQLAVPASLMGSNERVLNNGMAYKFKTAPVDPYDIFRGRYVAINIEQREAPLSVEDTEKLSKAKWNGYAIIGVGEDGYAFVERLVSEKPERENYFRTKIYSYASSGETGFFIFPIDRFYMNEHKAPKAEELYRKNMQGQRNAYMLVRVLNGKMVIEDLIVDEKPIASYF